MKDPAVLKRIHQIQNIFGFFKKKKQKNCQDFEKLLTFYFSSKKQTAMIKSRWYPY